MLEKLLERLNRPAIPDRIDVVRHRVAARLNGRGRLTGRGRSLVAITAAMAMIGLGALVANAAVTDGDASPAAEGATTALTADPALAEQREAEAERTDRSERSSSTKEKEQETKAEAPKSSPTPTEEAEPEAESEPAEEEADEAEEEEAETQEPPADWVHPMAGAATTSCYGQRWGVLHAGVDLAAPSGTPIKAVGAGTVTDAGWVFGGYGISVVIDHRNGVYTHYAHMSDTAVSPGESVSPGETIGYEGSTGDSTGPHLHFEVHDGMWNQIEPTGWMRDRGVDIGGC